MTTPLLHDDPAWVVVALSTPVRVEVFFDDRLDSVVVGDTLYRDSGLGDFTVFFEWLRCRPDEVIGVDFMLHVHDFVPTTDVIRPYHALPGVVVQPGRLWEVFFTEDRSFDPAISCDQDFGTTAVLRSDDGRHALAFQTCMLSRKNVAGIAGSLKPSDS